MSNLLEIIPQTAASTNSFGITFGATAEIEMVQVPEAMIDVNLANIELVSISSIGLELSKGSFTVVLPWSNIILFTF